MGILSKLLGLDAGKATIEAANKNRGLIEGFNTTGTAALDKGFAGAKGYLDDALSLTSLGEGANGIYGDALGLGGPEGTARARAAFQTGPGYQFQMDQGLQALDRRRAAAGSFQSGGADLDTLTFASGLADQEWDDWLGNLNTGINRQVGSLGDLATLYDTDASKRVGFQGDITSGLLGANNQIAGGEEANAAAFGKLGSSLFDLAGTALGRIPFKFGYGG